MSAPSKIAAIRHAVSALHGAADDGADTRRYADALQEAGAEIDALIEADAEWHNLMARMRAYPSTMLDREIRKAERRAAAALARVKGGAA